MPPSKADRYLHLEFLGNHLTHGNSDGMLAMHYGKDTLPNFLGTFVFAPESDTAMLINVMNGAQTSAKDASGRGNQGYAGRWIITQIDLIGTCFTPDANKFSTKLCVVLAPRYFLKTADATGKLGSVLAPCKPIDKRPSPTRAPDAYIYTTDELFTKHSYRFSEYEQDDLCVISTNDLRQFKKDQEVVAYMDPYKNLLEHEPRRRSECPHLQRNASVICHIVVVSAHICRGMHLSA